MTSLSADDARDAAAFRRLLEHLRARSDVANIDLMNLAGFCRNCLADWVLDAAADRGEAVDKQSARTYVYGMPYATWKSQQPDATPEQLGHFAAKP
ncbi:MAG: DUF1244 domain-containing protein [Lysobacterales bacterium]